MKEKVNTKDPYGIPNVCFSLINKKDERWKRFKEQRINRGFDESETWALGHTFLSFIYPRFKEYVKIQDKLKTDTTEEHRLLYSIWYLLNCRYAGMDDAYIGLFESDKEAINTQVMEETECVQCVKDNIEILLFGGW